MKLNDENETRICPSRLDGFNLSVVKRKEQIELNDEETCHYTLNIFLNGTSWPLFYPDSKEEFLKKDIEQLEQVLHNRLEHIKFDKLRRGIK